MLGQHGEYALAHADLAGKLEHVLVCRMVKWLVLQPVIPYLEVLRSNKTAIVEHAVKY